jgi:argininosuccinate lyase
MSAFIEAFTEAIGGTPKISETALRTVCAPEYFVAVRDMFGGPARMRESLESYKLALSEQEQRAAAHRARIERAARLRTPASS